MEDKDRIIGIKEKIEVFYFYDEKTGDTLKYVVELEKGGQEQFYTPDAKEACKRCVFLGKICQKRKKYYCLGNIDSGNIIACIGHLCDNISGLPSKILDISRIDDLNIKSKMFIAYDQDLSISLGYIIDKFCLKFCPLNNKKLSCRLSKTCPFHEYFKDTLTPFCLPLIKEEEENDK